MWEDYGIWFMVIPWIPLMLIFIVMEIPKLATKYMKHRERIRELKVEEAHERRLEAEANARIYEGN